MKPKFFLTSIFTFLLLNITVAQSQWYSFRSLISADKNDTIEIFQNYGGSLPRVPNSFWMRIESNTDTIKEIQVEEGTSEKLKDGTFLVKLTDVHIDRYFTFIGNKKYKYHDTKVSFSFPNYFCLKNFISEMHRDSPGNGNFLRYTIDDIIRNGKIIVFPKGKMDSVFRITEFQLSFRSGDKIVNFLSPVFKNDSIPSSYAESLRKYFTGPSEIGRLYFSIQNYKIIGLDSVIYKIPNNSQSAIIYKDSSYLLIDKYYYLNGEVTRSDLRIKLVGNPTSEDRQTVEKIVNEFNSLQVNIKAKIVRFLPSVVIHFDSIGTSLGRGSLTSRQMQSYKVNPFFPSLSYSELFLDNDLKDQHDRDLMLWELITRKSIATFGIFPTNNNNSIIIGLSKIPGLTDEDKLALKEILSKNYIKTAKLFGRTTSTVKIQVFLLVFISIILFFILYEIHSYFNFGRFVKNAFLLNSIYSILIAQLLIITSFLVQIHSLNDLCQSEIYFCGFALATGWFFIVSDRLLKKYISANWLKLLFNPFLTLISLYLSYQFIYLFVRGEFLRFITIDINTVIIGLSIIAVRFYLQYENEKITSLLQEKEYELTRQRELKNRAELSTLQAKINPHFLYNALNSIAALAPIDSSRTEEMALSLSKLFRYNVNREEDMVSTIRQEIEMVQLYLNIEKQRFADRLSFEVSADENLYERQVPRFLIQPLVENAIKHGISQITGQGIIKLKIFEQGKNLFIEVHDNGPEFPQGLVTGYGLQNTYDKLTLVYKNPYEIRFVNEPEKFIQIKL
ncbi:MAG: histidine kinase [Bacteroidia bacterium]|nr:histidine kinase [Bacteroidia bacterium]